MLMWPSGDRLGCAVSCTDLRANTGYNIKARLDYVRSENLSQHRELTTVSWSVGPGAVQAFLCRQSEQKKKASMPVCTRSCSLLGLC